MLRIVGDAPENANYGLEKQKVGLVQRIDEFLNNFQALVLHKTVVVVVVVGLDVTV